MFMKKGIYLILCQLCLLVLLCGCNYDTSQERDETSQATAAPLEDLTLEAEVASSTAIVVSWNELSRGTGYTLSRSNNDDNSPFEEIAQFKPGDTMEYIDTDISRDNKEGYLYNIAVSCEYSELDYATYDHSVLWKTKEDQTTVYTKIAGLEWLDFATEIAYCNQVRGKNQIMPDEIALYLDCSTDREKQPVKGVEIYRGTNPKELKMIDDVVWEERILKTEYGQVFVYEDQTVQYGKTYYYQVRPYAGITQRVYGNTSNVYRLAAVDAMGDYSVKLLTKQEQFTSSLRVKLSSNSAGNDALLFHPSNLRHLIDYVYETEEGNYHSMTLQLYRYRLGKGKWKMYQGESLALKAGKKIALEFVTKDPSDTLMYPSKHFKTAELIFRAEYNHDWQDYTIDLKKDKISVGNEPAVGQELYDSYQSKTGHKKLTLKAKVSEGEVCIAWNSIKGAEEYRILRAEEKENPTYVSYGKKREIACVSASETSFTDTGLLEDKGYRYVVQAYQGSGEQQECLTKDNICIYHGLKTPDVSLYGKRYDGGDGNYIQFPYWISELPAIRPDGIEIYRGTSKDSMVRIADRSVKESHDFWEYQDITYTDYTVISGKTYFYKLRGYKDTAQGRIYSEFSAPWEAAAYLYNSERYKMRVLTKDNETEYVSSFIIVIHSISGGNEDICFYSPYLFGYYSSENEESGDQSTTQYSYDGSGGLKITKYSYDGSNWKKMKSETKVVLSGKQTVYFQLESEKGVPNPNQIQENTNITCEATRKIANDGSYGTYITFDYDCRKKTVRASFWYE